MLSKKKKKSFLYIKDKKITEKHDYMLKMNHHFCDT